MILQQTKLMPRYKIQDSQTGRILTVEGDSEPTSVEISQLFEANPPIKPESSYQFDPIPKSVMGGTDVPRSSEERTYREMQWRKSATNPLGADLSLHSNDMSVPEFTGRALGVAGNVVKGVATDAAAYVMGTPEYSGNTRAALSQDPLPYDKATEIAYDEANRLGEFPWAGISADISGGLLKSTPKIAAMMASGGGLAVQSAVAGGLFGVDDEGKFHPKEAIFAALLPGVGHVARKAAAQGILRGIGKGVTALENPTAQKAIEFLSDQAAVGAMLGIQEAPTLMDQWKKDPKEFKKTLAKTIGTQLAFGLFGAKNLGDKRVPSETQAWLNKMGMQGAEQYMNDPAYRRQIDLDARRSMLAKNGQEQTDIRPRLEEDQQNTTPFKVPGDAPYSLLRQVQELRRVKLEEEAARNRDVESGLMSAVEAGGHTPFDQFMAENRFAPLPFQRPSGQAIITPELPSGVRNDVEGGRVSFRRGAEDTASIAQEAPKAATPPSREIVWEDPVAETGAAGETASQKPVEQMTAEERAEHAKLKAKDLTEDGLSKPEEQRLFELGRKETIAKRNATTQKESASLREAGVVIPDEFFNPSEGVENHITGWSRAENGHIQIRVESHTASSSNAKLITVKPGDTLHHGMNDAVAGTTRYKESNPELKPTPVKPVEKGVWNGSDIGDKPVTALRLLDGTILIDPSASIHAQAFENLGVDPTTVQDGGFVRGSEYKTSGADTGRIVRQANAKKSLEKNRTTTPTSETSGLIGESESARLDKVNEANASAFVKLSENQKSQLAVELGIRPIKATDAGILDNTHPDDLSAAISKVTGARKTPAETGAKGKDITQKLEDWADGVIRENRGKLLSPDPTILAAYGVKGAAIIGRGVKKFSDWSVEMVREYGDAIKPHLEDIYRKSRIQALKIINSGQEAPAKDFTFSNGETVQDPTPGTSFTNEPGRDESIPAKPKAQVGLEDIYKIFEPEPKKGTPILKRASNIIESLRTGVSSKFRPIDKLAQDIAKAYGIKTPKGIAGIFEQLKGSSGKGDADIYRFDRDVSDLVKGQEKDFNAYLFLKRSVDRLETDLRTGEGRRKVGNFELPELRENLSALESKLSPEQKSNFETAADAYQVHLDDALKLQVESGRMSAEVYDAIKAENQFYAPFKVMKYLQESMRPEGTGAKIDTVADYTKAMRGIESPDFKLGDMLAAGRQNLLISRILAEKNLAMKRIADLAPFDLKKTFIRKLGRGEVVPFGHKAVNVFENGKQERYVVPDAVANSVQIFQGPAASEFITSLLAKGSMAFRAGATTLNLPFQIANVAADIPRAALVSKYGIQRIEDVIQFPVDLFQSLFSSFAGNVGGHKNQLYLDFLDSGAAGSTIQESLRPNALQFKEPTVISKSKKLALTVLNTIPDISQAIEQTSKILGVKRAMRFEGAESGKDLANRIPEAITEIRRFSGSPDFGRIGSAVEATRANLLLMFLNARIQGTVSDLGRLGGMDGAKRSAITWLRLGAIAVPTAILYALNNSDKYRADYEKRSDQEKQNYWMFPKDSFITTEDGETMRDYARMPKREIGKWVANLTESALKFGDKKDPETFSKFAASMIQEISPVNIQGKNTQERLESVASGMHPLIKAPLELATGRDLYRHRAIVPDSMKKASPENQYTDRTAEVFKKLANVMPDFSPDFMRSPLMLENLTKNLTAGLITQFLPASPVKGRSELENNPLLKRFQALPYSDQTADREKLAKLETVAADEQLARHRLGMKAMEGKTNIKDAARELVKNGGDEKAIKHLVDLWVAKKNGITQFERQVLGLPVKQRAAYIEDQIQGKSPAVQREMMQTFAKKRILSEEVAKQIIEARSSQ